MSKTCIFPDFFTNYYFEKNMLMLTMKTKLRGNKTHLNFNNINMLCLGLFYHILQFTAQWEFSYLDVCHKTTSHFNQDSANYTPYLKGLSLTKKSHSRICCMLCVYQPHQLNHTRSCEPELHSKRSPHKSLRHQHELCAIQFLQLKLFKVHCT